MFGDHIMCFHSYIFDLFFLFCIFLFHPCQILSLASIILSPCLCEFDISILDRLSAVFNGSPFYLSNDSIAEEYKLQRNNQPSPFDVTIESSSIDVRLR